MPLTFPAPLWRGEKRTCRHCEHAYRQCVPGQAGCTQSAGLEQSGRTAGTHAVLLGTWDTGRAHQSTRGGVYRSRCSGRRFDLEASRVEAVPTIRRTFHQTPFRIRGTRADHTFCLSYRLPSRVVSVYSKAAMCFTRSEMYSCSSATGGEKGDGTANSVQIHGAGLRGVSFITKERCCC